MSSPTVPIVPQQSAIAPPPPRPIPGHSRLTGELVALIPSCTTPGLFHITTATSCSCKGFQYRQRCRHITTAQTERGIQDGGASHLAVARAAGDWPSKPAVSPETAAKAATYFEIFGSDE
jgi:SWIM zinc finger